MGQICAVETGLSAFRKRGSSDHFPAGGGAEKRARSWAGPPLLRMSGLDTRYKERAVSLSAAEPSHPRQGSFRQREAGPGPLVCRCGVAPAATQPALRRTKRSAGKRTGGRRRPPVSHICLQCGQLQGSPQGSKVESRKELLPAVRSIGFRRFSTLFAPEICQPPEVGCAPLRRSFSCSGSGPGSKRQLHLQICAG